MKTRSQARETMLAKDRTPALRFAIPELYAAEEDRRELMEQVRERLYQYAGDYRSAAQLASDTGVGLSTIYSIRCGKTRWPTWKTLFRLLKSLDLELALVDVAPSRLAENVSPGRRVVRLKPEATPYYRKGH